MTIFLILLALAVRCLSADAKMAFGGEIDGLLRGHGVGKEIHEDPYIPNFGKAGTGAKLVKGMVVALEPMLNNGTKNVKLDRDGWTFRTADGKKSAHFEHTILITDDEPEILTSLE